MFHKIGMNSALIFQFSIEIQSQKKSHYLKRAHSEDRGQSSNGNTTHSEDRGQSSNGNTTHSELR